MEKFRSLATPAILWLAKLKFTSDERSGRGSLPQTIMRISLLVSLAFILVVPALLFTGRVTVGRDDFKVRSDAFAAECSPSCSTCSGGTQTCIDEFCFVFSQSCSEPPPPPPPPPPAQVCQPNTDVGCPGGANYCTSSCSYANMQSFCNSSGTGCNAPIEHAHGSCAPGSICSGGSCVSSPGSCGDPTPPPPSGCTPGTQRQQSCTISACCSGTEVFECQSNGTWFSDGTCYDTAGCRNNICGGGSSHLECRSGSCVSVSGSGSNLCGNAADCCIAGATSCGACSASCGGGTQTCNDGCSSFTQSCNTQACCSDSTWTCVQPYNGTEQSNCGNTRANSSCNSRFITAGGASVYSGGSITGLYDSAYPAAYPYFNPSTYGIVSSTGDISLSTSKINAKGCKVTSYGLQQVRFD